MKISLLCSIGLLMAAPLTAQSEQDSVKVALDLLQQSQTEAAAGHLGKAADLAAKAQSMLQASQQLERELVELQKTIEIVDEQDVREELTELKHAISEDGHHIVIKRGSPHAQLELENKTLKDVRISGGQSFEECEECEESEIEEIVLSEFGNPRQGGGSLHAELQALHMELQALRLELQALRMTMGVAHGGMGQRGPSQMDMGGGMMTPRTVWRMKAPVQMRLMQKPQQQLFHQQMGDLGADMDFEFDVEGLRQDAFELRKLEELGYTHQSHGNTTIKVIINGEVFEGEAAREKLAELGMDDMRQHIRLRVESNGSAPMPPVPPVPPAPRSPHKLEEL